MAQIKPISFAAARAALPNGQWQRLLAKTALAGCVATVFCWLLINRLADIPLQETRLHVLALSPGQWLTACIATAASFWAVGRYDGVIHLHLATGADPAVARRAGATAIAVSQTLGFGVITGAILRWRMLPDQTFWQATKITTLVAAFFLAGWAAFTAMVIVVLPQAPYKSVAIAGLVVAAILLIVCAIAPKWRGLRWPNLFVMGKLFALSAIDTFAAALALWAVCPPEFVLPFATLLPAFLIALGAGLVSGAPAGLGAFEITMLALLPTLPEAPVLAAILAWRMIYFAAPAVIGAGLAILGPGRTNRAAGYRALPNPTATSRRAEIGLLAQGQLSLLAAGRDHAWLAGRTGHCVVALLDPLSPDPLTQTALCDQTRAIAALIDTARGESKMPVLYKCTARTAVAARKLGLTLHPIAREAVLNPGTFALSNPSRAGLRRKLRHAQAAGITVTTARHDCAQQDLAELGEIAAQWARRHGGERGFSMGRFDPRYLAGQRLYIAAKDGKPVAFASFHVGKHEWTLDLMRQTSTTPDGTMQAIIAQAIADACALGLPRLSLAAVPFAALTKRPENAVSRLIHHVLGGNQTGLAQFKQAFVPDWQTLYLAAPNRPGLALAGAEIAREVRFPPADVPGALQTAQHHHAEYEIASAV